MNDDTPTSSAPILTSAEVPETPVILENTSIEQNPTNPEVSPEFSPESTLPESSTSNPIEIPESSPPTEPKPSYVKLAMRNMVRKRGKSLQHFFLTTLALLGVLVGLAYLTR
jgi:hypothetical protein